MSNLLNSKEIKAYLIFDEGSTVEDMIKYVQEYLQPNFNKAREMVFLLYPELRYLSLHDKLPKTNNGTYYKLPLIVQVLDDYEYIVDDPKRVALELENYNNMMWRSDHPWLARRAMTPQVVSLPTLSVPTMRAGDYANIPGPDNYAFNSDVAALQESRRIAAQNAMVEALYEANTVPVKVTTAGGGTTTVRVPKEWGYTESELVTDPRATAIAQGEQPERYADPINNDLNWGIFTALTGGAAASNGAFSNTINGATNFTRALTNPATSTHLIVKPVLFSELVGRTVDLGYGLGNLLANGEYYTLTDNLTDMYRNLGLSDTWASVAGGLSNPGYWAGFRTRSLAGLENGGREALASEAIRRNAPPIIERVDNALIGRFPLYGNYRLSAAINRAALDFDYTVGPEYFRSPDRWYRITSSPEIYGIKELGKNVTTRDLLDNPNSANDFRLMVEHNSLEPGTGPNEGYWILPEHIRQLNLEKRIAQELGEDFNIFLLPRLFTKTGASHGNRSLGAWGHPWKGSTVVSEKFHNYIIEGHPLPDLTIPVGQTRSVYNIRPIEDVPLRQRIGFKTGEMPIEGLQMFRKLPNNRYLWEGPLLPDKRITLPLKNLEVNYISNFNM